MVNVTPQMLFGRLHACKQIKDFRFQDIFQANYRVQKNFLPSNRKTHNGQGCFLVFW